MTAPSFEQDIRPMFRERDRLQMDFVFDLWSYENVMDEADNILKRLADGTMPCDGRWSDQSVQLFRDWISGGRQP